MIFSDHQLLCRDCGEGFVFSASDQEAYAQRGFHNYPSRCPSCMAVRRARNPNGGASPSHHSGGMSFGREQRQLYPAICAECNQPTQVPFQPRTEKPVYCSDCFRSMRGA